MKTLFRHVLLALVFAAGYFLVATIVAQGCARPIAPPDEPSGGLGGAPATGGAAATGGSDAVHAGAPAMGGAAVVAYDPPPCNAVGATRALPRDRMPLNGYRPRKAPIRARARASYDIVPGLPSVWWSPNDPHALDQGPVGRCGGYAGSKLFGTTPSLGHATAQFGDQLYAWATEMDPFPGTWHIDGTGQDTGTTIEAIVKAGQSRANIWQSLESIETFEDLQLGLARGPCIVGTTWYESFFYPTRCGEISIHAADTVAGAHAYVLNGQDFDDRMVHGINSWGDDYGLRKGTHGGFFRQPFGTVVELMRQGAEVYCRRAP